MKCRCPLCGNPLTQARIHGLTKFQEHKEEAYKRELAKLQMMVVAAQEMAQLVRRKLIDARADAKIKIAAARGATAHRERQKNAIKVKKLIVRVKKLEEEKKKLAKRASSQQIGRSNESDPVKALRRDLSKGEIQHAGKGGVGEADEQLQSGRHSFA